LHKRENKMKLYKLTEQNGATQNNTFWGEGTTHSKHPTKTPQLCSPDVFHAYTDKNLAFLLNPIHANIDNPVLWECQGKVVVSDWGKVGCFVLTTKKTIQYPKWVNSKYEQDIRILFAILCAESVLSIFENQYPDDKRPRKAIEASKAYLQNKNTGAARAAAYAARAATYAAADADAARAADAADAAADAAYAARATTYAARATTYAADAATYAAYAATYAAADASIDFIYLAKIAVNTYMK
jgi:hypothetical protein